MRILFQCPALWCKTGYAAQSRTIIPELEKLGHKVVVSADWGLEGSPIRYNGIWHLPRGKHLHGEDTILAHFIKGNFDLLVTVGDAWLWNHRLLAERKIPHLPWIPIDDDPVNTVVLEAISDPANNKPYAKDILVYSKWGVEQLAKEGIKSRYIPEAIDTENFKDIGMDEARKVLGFKKDWFVVGIVAANVGWPSRKAFDKQIEGFAKFAKNHPEARLYIHTNIDASWRTTPALDIRALLSLLSRRYPVLKDRVLFPDQYDLWVGMPESYMAAVYSSFNVLLQATQAEGFGLPILEAQACGVPVIATDFSSMPELVKAGWLVKPSGKFLDSRYGYQVDPDVDDIARNLELAYKADPDKLAKEAREFALQFSPEKLAVEYWQPLLDEVSLERIKNGKIRKNTG